MIRFSSPTLLLLSLATTGLAGCAHRPVQSDREPAGARYAPFVIHASVALRCSGDRADRLVETASETFEPDASPFSEANGGLVPLLTARLQMSSDRLARDAALRICGAGKIVKVAPKTLHSGTWQADLPFECDRIHCVRSPYDAAERAGVEFARASTLDFNDAGHAGSKRSPLDSGPEVEASWRPASSCQRIIHARACYGDCMSNESACSAKGEWVETLLTPGNQGEDPLEICGDALAARLARERTPRALRPLECRLYFYGEAMKRSHAGLSCSSFRVTTPDCDSF